MRRTSSLLLVLLASTAAAQQAATPAPIDWRPVDAALGRAGTPMPGGVVRYGFPRTDLDVTVGDVHVLPALALGGWVAFLPAGDNAIVMGDLVLTLPEVAPVVRALQQGGVEITAEHNHLIGEEPRLMYVHIMGNGNPASIAGAIRRALDLSGTPKSLPPATPPKLDFPLDTGSLAKAAGVNGKVVGGVWQMSVPRSSPPTSMGISLPPAMGVASAINVQPIDSTSAAATGDFVLTTGQVPKVVQALTAHGFTVTAVHSHLMGSTPELLFVHFWGKDTDKRLAEGISAAVDAMR